MSSSSPSSWTRASVGCRGLLPLSSIWLRTVGLVAWKGGPPVYTYETNQPPPTASVVIYLVRDTTKGKHVASPSIKPGKESCTVRILPDRNELRCHVSRRAIDTVNSRSHGNLCIMNGSKAEICETCPPRSGDKDVQLYRWYEHLLRLQSSEMLTLLRSPWTTVGCMACKYSNPFATSSNC
jgi:hypothetical protein